MGGRFMLIELTLGHLIKYKHAENWPVTDLKPTSNTSLVGLLLVFLWFNGSQLAKMKKSIPDMSLP